MSRRNIILIVGFIILVMFMMVAGNIIIVAQRIATAVHWAPAEYVVYALLLAGFAYIFLLPLWRIHRAPQLPAMEVREGESIKALQALAASLASNMNYITDGKQRAEHTRSFRSKLAATGGSEVRLRGLVEDELARRFDGDEALGVAGVNARIKSWATTSFLVTAVSQNGTFDTISVIMINIRMIADIVRASGYRPTRRQLFGIYVNVLITALLTFMLSNALEGTGDVAPFAFLDGADASDAAADATIDGATDLADTAADAAADSDSAFSPYALLKTLKIPAPVVSSALDGAANALMTFRIGYITRSYLREGAEAFKGMAAKRRIKRAAMLEAVKGLPGVLSEGASVVGKGTVKIVSAMMTPRPAAR